MIRYSLFSAGWEKPFPKPIASSKKMKKRLKKTLIWSFFLLIFGIAGLELYTSRCNCVVPPETAARITAVPICENGSDEYPFAYDADQRQLIDEIIEKRGIGESITKAEYGEAIDLLVYEVPPEQLGGLNGVVCRQGVAFVRESLPELAKQHVARHELEHLFQTTDVNQEVDATIAASKEYPIGLLATIVSSLIMAKEELSWCCFLKSSWAIFKLYFLGIDFRRT